LYDLFEHDNNLVAMSLHSAKGPAGMYYMVLNGSDSRVCYVSMKSLISSIHPASFLFYSLYRLYGYRRRHNIPIGQSQTI
jgi:hypothetical protein